jgi:hypothetical protein
MREEARSLARSYYAVAGLIGVAIPALVVVGTLASGCGIAFSQADFGETPAIIAPGDTLGCLTYVDPVFHSAALVMGMVLLGTAFAFGRQGGAPRALVRFGALVGIAAAYLPAAIIWWVVTDHRQTPIGILEIAATALPFVIALAAAWVAWRAHRGSAIGGFAPER